MMYTASRRYPLRSDDVANACMPSHITSEDTKSSTHGGHRVLVPADPDPGDSSSGDDGSRRPLGNHQASYSSFHHSSPPIVSQSSYPSANQIVIPPNITSLSNPTLSSPSSQSSNTVESTPPSSTLGQAAPPDIVSTLFTHDDGSSVNPDLPQHSRIQQISDESGKPRRASSHHRLKDSEGSLHPPTPSCNLSSSERIIMVTYDCHPFTTVDVTPATSAAFVWEQIFTELKIPDEDQSSGFAIYRTQVSRAAVGEALNNDSLLQLIKDQGDGEGNLKFLVCHPHARVHGPPLPTSPIGSIPPPPSVFAPLVSRSKASQSSRQESISSEDPTGYEPSVMSDDLDDADRNTLRPRRQYIPNLPSGFSPSLTQYQTRQPPSPVSTVPCSSSPADRRHQPDLTIIQPLHSTPTLEDTLTLPRRPYRRGSITDERGETLQLGDTERAMESANTGWTRTPTGTLVDKAKISRPGDGTSASDEITVREQESLLVRRASRSSPCRRVPRADPRHQSHLASNSVSKFGDISFREDGFSGTTLPLSGPYTPPTTQPETPPRSPVNAATSRPSTSTSSSTFTYAPSGTIMASRQNSSPSGQDTLSESTLRPGEADKVIWGFKERVAAHNLSRKPNLSVDTASSSDDCAGVTTPLWSRKPISQLVREDMLGSPRSGPRPTLEVVTQNLNDLRVAPSNFGVSDQPQLSPRLRDPRPRTPGDGHKSTVEEHTWAHRPPPEDAYDRLEELFSEHDLDKLVIEANSGGTSPTIADPSHSFSSNDRERPNVLKARAFEENAWAHRPPPEDVYDRLEDFFPEHDLDKPVIEADPGGTSPANADPSHGFSSDDRERPNVRGKRSIRLVAEEHKKQLDRTSRAKSSYGSLLRRSTEPWGGPVEEVNTPQTKLPISKPAVAASSGGPRPIFKWVRGELIGKGTHGRVYVALNATTGEIIAVKQVEILTTASDKSDGRQASLVRALKQESETLSDLDHPHIVAYLGFEETPNVLSIFLEYVPGGSVGSCLRDHGKLDEEVTKSFTAQILDGLAYLHSKNIIHRDLKADHILVEKTGICKISDFGISKRADDDQAPCTPMQGSVFWMAPEVIGREGYNAKVDIWSVGCVVLEMWTGRRPWPDEDFFTVMFKVSHEGKTPPIPSDVILSDLAVDFKDRCLVVHPDARSSAAELIQHPYLKLPDGWVFNGPHQEVMVFPVIIYG